MLSDELISYLFDEQPHLLTQPMATWIAASRRFTAFVTTFRDKIRKKLRVTQDRESILDLRLELETAYLLLQERSLNLVYEPQLADRARSPDFAVTFTTSLTFMVEVTRLRAYQKVTQPEVQAGISLTNPLQAGPPVDERLVDTICSKLSQLLPQQSNVLLVGVELLRLTEGELRATMLRLQQRAERNDPTFLQRHRFHDRARFYQYYQRLSEILVRGPQAAGAKSPVVWVNPQAKHPLPRKVQMALYRSQAA